MGKFLDLMVATEAEWDAETGSAEVPEGTYIFQLKNWKARQDKDDCQLYFTVVKPHGHTPADFRSDKYRPIQVLFSERNAFIFRQFLKASGIALNNVQSQMPKLIGKYYTGDVVKSEGKDPNPDGTKKIFTNLNNIKPFNPHETASTTQATVAVEDDDEDGSLG